jgi:uncharacterized membrane protein
LLFWLCLVPFPTQFIGAHPTAPFAIFLYALDMLLASLALLLMRRHAVREGLFESERAARLHGPKQSLLGIGLNTLALVFAFVNVYVSLACLILVPLLYFVPWAWRAVARGVKAKAGHTAVG